MKTSRWPIFVLFLGLVAVLLLGFSRLFVLRFQAGDVYPANSSLRADPLGTKVLYDALGDVPGLAVERNFEPADKIAHPENATVFYAGLPNPRVTSTAALLSVTPGSWEAEDGEHLEKLARDGGRIVLTFLPVDERPARDGEPEPTEKPKDTKNGDGPTPGFDVLKHWGFAFGYRQRKPRADPSRQLVAHAVGPEVEPQLSWHTALYFLAPDSSWHVLYRCAGLPVVMERAFGRGSIVIATDCFFLSNEAMQNERAPRLLAWLLGTHSRVLFDETHLGVAENPGVASLIRKYNLETLLAAIAVLAGLFVWQTASPFLPAKGNRATEQIVTGKDSATGFVTFLRRGIAPSRLIEVCLEQWKKSGARRPAKWNAALAQMEAVASAAAREPVAAYQKISRILAEKK